MDPQTPEGIAAKAERVKRIQETEEALRRDLKSPNSKGALGMRITF